MSLVFTLASLVVIVLTTLYFLAGGGAGFFSGALGVSFSLAGSFASGAFSAGLSCANMGRARMRNTTVAQRKSVYIDEFSANRKVHRLDGEAKEEVPELGQRQILEREWD